MVSQSELVAISAWTKQDLHRVLSGRGFNKAMFFMRNMQMALTEYSKRHKVDNVQMGVLSVINQTEKWLRDAYFQIRWPELLRTNSSLALKPKKAAKNIMRAEFEAMISKAAY